VSDSDACTLEALFVVNQVAKRYGTNASEAYEAGLKADARLFSVRKRTLYRYKTYILEQWYRDGVVDRVERHHIDGREYYCLFVDGWSYHCPVDRWGIEGIESTTAETRTISNFDSTAAETDDTMSERVAFRVLTEQFGSPNDFLVQPFVEREYGSAFTGWSFLPGTLEVGSTVPEPELHEEHRPEFLFAVGDRFETLDRGTVEIVDRYGKWLDPRWHSGPVVPREVYDVTVDGSTETGVRQERIHEDWQVRVRDPAEPCADIEGRLGELVGAEYDGDPGFREGDVVILDPPYRDGPPRRHRIERMTASWSLVLCKLHATQTDDRIEWLAIEEFLDDIVAIENDRPAARR